MADANPTCPVASLGKRELVKCGGSLCAWWIKGEERPGGCCIPRLAHYAAAFLKLEGKLSAMFEEKHEWDRRDQPVHPIDG